MKKIDISEYDSGKEYQEGTEFVLDDAPPQIPVPDFLKDKDKDNNTAGV